MIRVNYVTSSKYKAEEINILKENCTLSDGTPIKNIFDFHLYPNTIHERLEVDIEKMVTHEVKKAYSMLKIPCIVEHAGLIFENHLSNKYPGGLTKPMWNTLKDDFISETNSSKIKVFARAFIGFCDGKNIYTFMGETKGSISDKPKGSRDFYWDTIFIPEGELNLTYAEIVDTYGLKEKIVKYSQSTKAMIGFLDFIYKKKSDDFWD
jgi:XTP/dITP diphosphohydrolase